MSTWDLTRICSENRIVERAASPFMNKPAACSTSCIFILMGELELMTTISIYWVKPGSAGILPVQSIADRMSALPEGPRYYGDPIT